MDNKFAENGRVGKGEKEETKSLEWLSGMLAHHVDHFLMLSKAKNRYHDRHLEKSKEMIRSIKEKVDDAELISKLDELRDELEKVNSQLSEVDGNLLDNIRRIEDQVSQIIKIKGIK